MGVYTFLLVSKQQDKCNGRRGVTPEYPNSINYVNANDFPCVPLCFKGIPDASFKICTPNGMMIPRNGLPLGQQPTPQIGNERRSHYYSHPLRF
jgi:hypothetical protein